MQTLQLTNAFTNTLAQWTFKVHFMILLLWHCSVDIDKISLCPNFQSIRRLRLRLMHVLLYCTCCIGHYAVYFSCRHNKKPIRRLFPQASEFARNILHVYIMYLKASTDVKIATFLMENGGWGCGSRNGPLKRMKTNQQMVNCNKQLVLV